MLLSRRHQCGAPGHMFLRLPAYCALLVVVVQPECSSVICLLIRQCEGIMCCLGETYIPRHSRECLSLTLLTGLKNSGVRHYLLCYCFFGLCPVFYSSCQAQCTVFCAPRISMRAALSIVSAVSSLTHGAVLLYRFRSFLTDNYISSHIPTNTIYEPQSSFTGFFSTDYRISPKVCQLHTVVGSSKIV